jgi:hypothetical protein
VVRKKLGYEDHSNSYIHFLILKLTGLNLREQFVDTITVIVFILAFVLSVWLNVKDSIAKSKKKGQDI